ncbi:MAG: D-2-hydroxyacid dehydrogenase [Treponema sp.]|nr:D-2-hydroxyacid dehydrogenase [Treponema sp.]
MKITVLDGHAANPGDVSWDLFKQYGNLTIYDRTPQELVIERIGDSEAILLNKIQITKEVIDSCPNLKYIGVLATGYNVVDIDYCKQKNIIVTNIPSYSTNSVAQHVFAFILEFTNLVKIHSDSVKNGDWIHSPDFCYWTNPLSELSNKTIGIYGFGNIGQQVAKIAHAFNMNVIVHVHNNKSYTNNEKVVSLDELFSSSDFVTLHAPLTKETENIINEKTISKFKNSAILINTARGGLVDENAVKNALNSDKLAGYATDVLKSEPMDKNCPLLTAKNCIITPHIAWAPKETRERLLNIAAENLKAFINKTPINMIN